MQGWRRRDVLRGATAVAALATAGTTAAGRQDDREPGDVRWTFDRIDAPAVSTSWSNGLLYVRDVESPSPVYALDVASGEVVWEYEPPVDAVLGSSYTGSEQVVYYDREDGFVCAIDAVTGEEHWTVDVDGATSIGGIGTDHELVLLRATDEGVLYALDRWSGSAEWTYDAGPGFSDGWLDRSTGTAWVVEGDRETLTVIDAADGSVDWQATPPDGFSQSITWVRIDGDRTFVGDQSVHVYDTGSGEHRQSFAAEAEEVAYVTPVDDELYAEVDDSALAKYDLATGEELWRFESEGRLSPSVRERHLEEYGLCFAGIWGLDDGAGALVAIDAADGSVAWRPDVDGGVIGPSTWGDAIHFDTDDRFYAVDHATGDLRWELDVPEEVYLTEYEGDRTYVGTRGGVVYAVEEPTGEVVWTFDAPDNDGRLRARTTQDHLVAVPGRGDGSTVYGLEADFSRSAPSTPAPASGFDPSVDGFGFGNWAGERGCPGASAVCDPDEEFALPFDAPTLDDVRATIDDEWEADLGRAQLEVVSRAVHAMLARQTATNGHCYGMVFAAEDYFHGRQTLPEPAETPSDVTRPTGRFRDVGDLIREYHASQLIDSEGFWLLVCSLQFGRVDESVAVAELREAIDARGTAGVALANHRAGGHQVLAFDYEAADGEVAFAIYDPNVAAPDYPEDPDDPSFQLVVDADTGAIREDHLSYDYYAYNEPNPGASLGDRIVGSAEDVWGRFRDALSFRLNSPASLAVEAPEGAAVVHPAAEESSDEALADAAFVLDAADGDYRVDVVAEGEGAFGLESYGVRGGETVLDETVEGEVTPGTAERYRVTVDDADAAVVHEGTVDVAESLFADWRTLAVGGGLATAVGLGYLRYVRDADDGE